jgi:hypothetical protein
MTREQRKQQRRRDLILVGLAVLLAIGAAVLADWIMPAVY